MRTLRPKTGDRIRRIDAATGIVTTIAGNGDEGLCGDGGPAVDACLTSDHFTLDRDGAVLIDSYGRVRRVDPRTGIIDLVAGDPAVNCLASDGSPSFDACAGAEALDADGHPVFIDRLTTRIRRVTLACGNATLDPGETCDDGDPCTTDAPVCDAEIGCTHAPLPEAAGLVCRCENVFRSPFCDDIDGVARPLGMRVKQVCKALAKAVDVAPGTRRALQAAVSLSTKAAKAHDELGAAANAGRIDGGCAEDVAETLLELAAKGASIAAGTP